MADEQTAIATERFVPSSVAAFNAASEEVAKEATPRAFEGTATPMGELAKAGVELAKRVMLMIAVAIVVLVLMALIAESNEMSASNRTTELIFAAPRTGSSSREDKQLAGVVALLRKSAREPALVPPPIEAGNAALLIERALKIPIITAQQKSDIDKTCIPLPARDVKDRAAILERCAATLETLFSVPAPDAQYLAIIKELHKSQAEERTARRAFWMQIAQLVLINLLLPILTALLGYIFGTRQAS